MVMCYLFIGLSSCYVCIRFRSKIVLHTYVEKFFVYHIHSCIHRKKFVFKKNLSSDYDLKCIQVIFLQKTVLDVDKELFRL